MAKRTFVVNALLTVAGLVALGVTAADADEGATKVTVCHVRPSGPAHTITVREAAVSAHLAHGDQLGECGSGCVTDTDCTTENACTLGSCENGECAYLVVDCFDLDPCTNDACDGAGGCTHTPTESPPEASEVTCDDELDNDCDGAADAEDSDCVVAAIGFDPAPALTAALGCERPGDCRESGSAVGDVCPSPGGWRSVEPPSLLCSPGGLG